MVNPKLVVLGVGGGGSNAVDRMMQVGLAGVEYVVANTDAQSLARSEAPTKILLGSDLMRGRGAGGDPQWGMKAADATRDEIADALKDVAIVFLATGLGGGTGTGASPILARIARERGALVVGIITLPFAFEGKRRLANAEKGLAALTQDVDTLVVVPNECLLNFVDTSVSLDVAFRVADDILRQGIEGISSLITTPGLINLDLASVQETLRQAGGALLAIGYGEGEQRARHAARAALDSPLIDMSAVNQAKNVLVNITGGPDLTLFEVREAMELVNNALHPDAAISMGAIIDPLMCGRMQMTLIAGGLKNNHVIALQARPQFAKAQPRLDSAALPDSTRSSSRRLREIAFEMPELKRRATSA